jgi:hypothetical protein
MGFKDLIEKARDLGDQAEYIRLQNRAAIAELAADAARVVQGAFQAVVPENFRHRQDRNDLDL